MRRFVYLALCGTLGACTQATYPVASSPEFGDAVRHNRAAHIVSPTVADPRLGLPADGRRAALAMERYQTDQVEAPATTAISDVAPQAVGGESSVQAE